MSKLSIPIRKIIRRYGRHVKIRYRDESIVDGKPIFTYSDPEIILGQFEMLTDIEETWLRVGLRIDADYRGTVLPDTKVNVGDIIELDDGWYEVIRLIYRYTAKNIDFKELLLRKRA